MLPVRVYATRRKFKCQICEEFARDTYPPVLRHIGEVHSFEPNFHVVCGLILDSTQAVCSATYSNHGSFRSHVYSKHRQVMNLHSTTQPTGEISFEEDREEGYNNAEMVNSTADSAHHRVSDSEESQITRAAALFILKTTEMHHVSQV